MPRLVSHLLCHSLGLYFHKGVWCTYPAKLAWIWVHGSLFLIMMSPIMPLPQTSFSSLSEISTMMTWMSLTSDSAWVNRVRSADVSRVGATVNTKWIESAGRDCGDPNRSVWAEHNCELMLRFVPEMIVGKETRLTVWYYGVSFAVVSRVCATVSTKWIEPAGRDCGDPIKVYDWSTTVSWRWDLCLNKVLRIEVTLYHSISMSCLHIPIYYH